MNWNQLAGKPRNFLDLLGRKQLLPIAFSVKVLPVERVNYGLRLLDWDVEFIL